MNLRERARDFVRQRSELAPRDAGDVVAELTVLLEEVAEEARRWRSPDARHDFVKKWAEHLAVEFRPVMGENEMTADFRERCSAHAKDALVFVADLLEALEKIAREPR